jgi:hypothetical protein
MRRLNCRPGELAIVVNSFDPANIGSIVKVLGRDAKACGKQFFWRIHAVHLLTYAKGDKKYRRRKGSIADADLQPIRGYPLGMDIAIGVTEQMFIKDGRLRVFDVDMAGTITFDVPEPKTNAEAFRLGGYRTVGQLISTVQDCSPLEFAVEQAVLKHRVLLGDDRSSLAQEDADWCEWIAADEKALTWVIAFIDAWLEMDVDFDDSEFFQCTSSEGYALRYFERLGVETLDQLGVYIIESEHPASSFNAAVLREDIDYANQVARSMGLEFRLQRVG